MISRLCISVLIGLSTALLLTGCAKDPPAPEQPKPPTGVAKTESSPEAAAPAKSDQQADSAESADGKYYKDDGPPAGDEIDWRSVAEPVVSFAPIDPRRNRPYEVFGVRYFPFAAYTPYREQGMASWYGRRYHGRKTSSGETYDMFAMTAAHPILPIPSFARVTRVDDGTSIVVRINDRGPFLHDRIIDLSYTAARKLAIADAGTGEVIVEALLPDDHVLAELSTESQDAQNAAGLSTSLPSGSYLQLGAFSVRENALRLIASASLPDAMQLRDLQIALRDRLHKVLLGPYQTAADAYSDRGRLRAENLEAILLIVE